jgi:predicted site-specific integrase-resolvase
MQEKQNLSRKEAADYLCLSPRTLEKWAVTGEGPVFHRLGTRVIYCVSDLDDFISQGRRKSTSDDGNE